MSNLLLYLASLPERLPRAAAASAGGVVYEASLVLLPGWARDMQIYQALIGRGLRIVVEWAGGVEGVMPSAPMTAGRLAARKLAGNAVEFTSILMVGWSPLWWLAGATDVTDGAQVYLSAVKGELQQLQMLQPGQDFVALDGLLEAVGGTTGVLSKVIDIPPLAQAELDEEVAELREAWQTLREKALGLSSDEDIRVLRLQMQQAAERENASVWAVSHMIAMAALQAGIKLGDANIVQFYRSSLAEIRSSGLPAYYSQVTRPYMDGAARHMDPQQKTYTERALSSLKRALGRGTRTVGHASSPQVKLSSPVRSQP